MLILYFIYYLFILRGKLKTLLSLFEVYFSSPQSSPLPVSSSSLFMLYLAYFILPIPTLISTEFSVGQLRCQDSLSFPITDQKVWNSSGSRGNAAMPASRKWLPYGWLKERVSLLRILRVPPPPHVLKQGSSLGARDNAHTSTHGPKIAWERLIAHSVTKYFPQRKRWPIQDFLIENFVGKLIFALKHSFFLPDADFIHWIQLSYFIIVHVTEV